MRVPNGFAITAQAFRDTLTEAGAWEELHRLLDGLDKRDVGVSPRRRGLREIVYAAGLTEEVQQEVRDAYRRLREQYGAELQSSRCAARRPPRICRPRALPASTTLSSTCRGEAMLLDAIRRCNASLFTDRAISYRIDQGFDHFKVALSVGVMKMVRSDLAASGVMFSLDTETGYPDMVFITGAYGIGENVVKGTVDPDEFYVHKPTFRQGYRAVLRRVLGDKQVKMIYAHGRTREPVRNIPTPEGRPCAVLRRR